MLGRYTALQTIIVSTHVSETDVKSPGYEVNVIIHRQIMDELYAYNHRVCVLIQLSHAENLLQPKECYHEC